MFVPFTLISIIIEQFLQEQLLKKRFNYLRQVNIIILQDL